MNNLLLALPPPKPGDDELFCAIRAYRRLMVAAEIASERGEPTERLVDLALVYRATIQDFRPATLAGVLVSLEFAAEADPEADYSPTGAIEGLRAIIEKPAP